MKTTTMLRALHRFASEYSDMMEPGRTGRLPARRHRSGVNRSEVHTPERCR